MEIFGEKISYQVPQPIGDRVVLKTTEKRHWDGTYPPRVKESPAQNFGEMLVLALQKVNDQQIHAQELIQKVVADPRSVDTHTVAIAMAKARMSLQFTKTFLELAIRTYRELTNLR